jgi:hypothetical protein
MQPFWISMLAFVMGVLATYNKQPVEAAIYWSAGALIVTR